MIINMAKTKTIKTIKMETIETILNISEREEPGYNYKYIITYMNIKGEPVQVPLPTGIWNKGSIIDALIRSQYSQDQVEAIINNHFLNISEWMDLKFKGEDVKFSDPEYDEFQRWRKRCKVLAEEALAQYPAIN